VARRQRHPSGSAVPLLGHLPGGVVRPDRPRRLRIPAALNDPRSHQAAIEELWDWEDPITSHDRFRAAANSTKGVERDILVTQVARALGLSKRFEEATALLDSLDHAADPELAVRVLLERGRILNSSGSPDAARPLFEQAFAAASSAGFEHLAIDALHMVAIVAQASEQDELNRRAVDLASAADDPRARRWRASLLNNLGWSAFERGDLVDALTLFEDALAERLGQGQVAEILVARWCIGRTLRALGRLDDALALQRSLKAELVRSGKADPYVDEEIALLTAGSPPTPE
jgi:tetratricopeptide (TPR) repeat protein